MFAHFYCPFMYVTRIEIINVSDYMTVIISIVILFLQMLLPA